MYTENRPDEVRWKNQLTAEFPAIPENEALARSLSAAFAAQADPTVEELTEIRTAVSEAVSNAVIHGYPQGNGQVRLELYLGEDGQLTIIVEDHGVGIEDVSLAREPLFTTGKDGERSGMGFTVMESFTDRLDVISELGKGTRVTMTKRLDLSYER
ncbi:MAG: anti-sigma F factor [Firmicutes bacterium]|nr:anti-sigma F factor [Bacillota bacterium]